MGLSTTEDLVVEDLGVAHLLYGLMSVFALFLMPLVLALLINFTQKSDAGSVLNSHFRWQRFSIFTFLMACVTAYFVNQFWLAFTLMVFFTIWFVYRIIRGWLNLVDGKLVG